MTTARRLTAIAAALFALSSGVSAAALTLGTIDVESAGQTAIDQGKPGAVTSEANGRLTFSGAFAYHWKMLDPTVDESALPGEFDPVNRNCEIGAGNCNEGGFIVNRNRGDSGGSDVVLELNRSVPGYAGAYFQSIIFDLFTSSSEGIDVFFYSATDTRSSDNFSPGDGNKSWVKGTRIDVERVLENVTRIKFAVDSSTLGLDNLVITLGGVTDVPAVPEPGSYALVGLALLAAGAARRRRA